MHMKESEPNRDKMVIGDWLIPMLVISAGLGFLYISQRDTKDPTLGVTLIVAGLAGLGISLRNLKSPK